jgi:CBS domain-containing protein
MNDATRMAGICGMLIAAMLVLFGIYILIAPNWRPSQPYFMGGWSILVGLFLFDTAAKVVKGAQGARLATVGDAMSPPIVIEPNQSIIRLIDDILPLHRQTSFPVAVNGRLHGILSLEDLKSLPRERWANTKVRTVMRPTQPGFFVEPSTTLESARRLMKDNGVGSIAVINSRGELIGFLHSGKIRRI